MKCLDGRRPARPVLFATLAMALLFGALAARSDAQVLYGSIVGNAADASKAAVPGAAVTILHKETNLARETVTRSDGSYTFVNVQPGTYTVRVVLAGFKESVKENVPVSATPSPGWTSGWRWGSSPRPSPCSLSGPCCRPTRA